MKRSVAALVSLLVALVVLVAGPPAAARSPYCGITWGSQPKSAPPTSVGQVEDFRFGRHACFDRMVIDVSGRATGYFVRYVDEVRRDGSGDVVPLRGGARLEVVVVSPVIATDAFFLPNGELVDPRHYRTFRHAVFAGADEHRTSFALGVRARTPFRVLVVPGGPYESRIVVDVAHRW